MIKQLMFCTALIVTTPLMALTADEQKILEDAFKSDDYTVNYKEICKTAKGKREAEHVQEYLSGVLTNMAVYLDKTKISFSHKRNDFEKKLYPELLAAYNHVTKVEQVNADNFYKYCDEASKPQR